MKTIWKFPFEIVDAFEIEMPLHAKLLHVELQDGRPCLWAFVDTEREKGRRMFRLYGTGHPIEPHHDIPDDIPAWHVGTFLMPAYRDTNRIQTLVWHLFDYGWMTDDEYGRGV